jgi:NADPH:quinone reductase-like Zn-dependent oxidoreductase
MQAIVQKSYGPPSVLSLQEIENPEPKPDEILIQIKATAINPLDWHFMRGAPYFMRFQFGLFRPKIKTVGADVAGIVISKGSQVKQFEIGDKVMGILFSKQHMSLGGLAEYAAAPEALFVHMPAEISFAEAAALPVAGLTAYHGLFSFGDIQPDDEVLVNGASGGVGIFTVQLAKNTGARVTGVCSTKNVELVRSLGAEEVIDYTKTSLDQLEQSFDLIIDNVGNYSVKQYAGLLKPGGKCAIIGYGGFKKLLGHMLQSPRLSKKTGKKIGMVSWEYTKKDLAYLADQMEQNKLRSIVSKTYILPETSKAMDHLETGHAVGKVVVEIGRYT